MLRTYEKPFKIYFGIQSRAEEDFLRQTFQTTRKCNLNMEDYLRTMKNNVDNLGQAGSPVPPRALVSHVLLGLDEVYNPVIVVIQARKLKQRQRTRPR
ncbi:hypothetical protein IC582_005235 [Cucumis melo]